IEVQRARIFEERRLASLGSMAFQVAHEINSPLAALDLHVYQLESIARKGPPDPRVLLEKIGRIQKVSRRIAGIVRSLKSLTGGDSEEPVPRAFAEPPL